VFLVPKRDEKKKNQISGTKGKLETIRDKSGVEDLLWKKRKQSQRSSFYTEPEGKEEKSQSPSRENNIAKRAAPEAGQ